MLGLCTVLTFGHAAQHTKGCGKKLLQGKGKELKSGSLVGLEKGRVSTQATLPQKNDSLFICPMAGAVLMPALTNFTQ